jgi:hypothetical protein
MRAVLLSLTLAWGVLLCSTARATDDPNARQKALQMATPTNPRKALAKPSHGSIPLPKPVTPQRVTNNPKNLTAGKTISAGHHESSQAKNPANASSNGIRSGNPSRLVRPALVPRPPVSTQSNVRHHGPNPAILGGPKNTSAAGTAALSGTALHRRQDGIAP